MNLLPKTREEFAQSDYWNAFFKKRGEKTFEWYGEYLDLCEHIHKYIKPADKILMLGCGNSKLSMDMYDAGFRDITNIDVSPVAIKKMIELNSRARPDMKFLQMDATAMAFDNEKFSVALDKGTLDALFVDDSENTCSTIDTYFKEIIRIMRNGGRYLCISLLQDHIQKYLIEFFSKNSFMVRVVHCRQTENDNAMTMPIFFVIATKFKSLPAPILEFSLDGEKLQRIKTVNELIVVISSVQKTALVCNGLARGSIADNNEVTMDLCKPGEEIPRYTVYVLDQPPKRDLGKYAAFMVPQGREIEWLFSTKQGRQKLQATAKYQRLAIVTLHRDQEYDSLDAVKLELANSIRSLAPQNLKEQIPFLSLGADVGKRETLVCGFSQISGDFRIEEVEGTDSRVYRRLIFLSNQFVVQSEALVKIIKPKGKKERKKIDVGYLACQHHLYMSIGVQLVTAHSQAENDILVIGLGGGGLCTFLHEALINTRVTAVEIDPIMLEIAEQFFELKQDNRLHVVIDDGIAFIERCKVEGIKFSAVLFDVDSKDTSIGLSCPPPSFLAKNILEIIPYIIDSKGIFILNLVCRDEELREKYLNDLKAVFSAVCCFKLSEDINEVIFCSNNEKYKNLNDWKKALGSAARNLNSSVIEKKLLSKKNEEIVDVTDFLQELKL